MEWQSIYRERLTTPDEAVKMVSSGDRIVLAHAASEPKILTDALCRRYEELQGVKLWQGLNIGDAAYCDPKYAGHIEVDSVFLGTSTRQAVAEQRGEFAPLPFSLFHRALTEGFIPVDGFFTTVTPPDEEGYCNLGISVDYGVSAIQAAKYIIAVVNKNVPHTYGNDLNRVHVSQLAAIVEDDTPVLEIPIISASDPTTEQIGKNIADLIEDGATLQMGQGKIPNAILKFLENKKDLGVHTEVFSDNLLPLIEKGIITGERKNIDKGKIVATFIQGTKALYDFVDNNDLIRVLPAYYTNSPFVIAQNDKVVAINAALEIDLMGQVVAEAQGSKQYSGLGGQLDFIRGAAYSKGGKPIIAMPSTAKGGTISKITAMLKPGTPVTTSRNDVHWVVTEYGAVNLFGQSLVNRAKLLISIAHPNFRDDLERDLQNYLKSMN